jgi:GntR family transcriptional regulator/MocR family aminotransferase
MKKRNVLFVVDKTSGGSLYQQLYEQVRAAIIEGRLLQGDHLPSIRRLSEDLQLSHTTVEKAYLQLSVEGYVANKPRSGYVVEHIDTQFLQQSHRRNEENVARSAESRSRDAFFAEDIEGGIARYDFSYANLQPDSFPVKLWRQLINDVLYANTAPAMAKYGYTDQPNELSLELARYLRQTRGVDCLPEQVILQAGTDGSIATIFQLFDNKNHVIGLEEPGYATVREVAQRMGFKLVPLPIDQGPDAFLHALRKHNPKLVFVTPSHQFPTGSVLSIDARTELLKWAGEMNSYIIEDDSCSEYRYNTSPVPSLHSLDAYNRVIYLCNVSKVLSPSLRIAYIVLPPKLLGRYFRLFNYAHPAISLLEQQVLARFIGKGYWEQHVRRMFAGNRIRHDLLLKCLETQFGDRMSIEGVNAGMHLFVTVHNDMTQTELLASARQEGAAVYGTKRFWFSKPAPENKLMIGFSAISKDDIPAGVQALKRSWL